MLPPLFIHNILENSSPDAPILAGIEWEFLVCHSDIHDYHPEDPRWLSRPDAALEALPEGQSGIFHKGMSSYRQTLAKVEDTLRSSAGLIVFSSDEAEDRDAATYLLQKNKVKLIDHVNWLYQAYSTTTDGSLQAGDRHSNQWMDTRYDWLGVELRSRVFKEKELDETTPGGLLCSHGVAAKEITAICASLRANMRLQINHTCALQVTLSHQAPGGLSLLSLKRILTLVYILEPLIFGLCAPYRQRGIFCRPITTCSELSEINLDVLPEPPTIYPLNSTQPNHPPYWEHEFNTHFGTALSTLLQNPTTSTAKNPPNLPLLTHHLLCLWHAPNATTLSSLVSSTITPCGRLSAAVKFLGSGPITNGVEFRMHEGTLDPVLVKLWMNFCVALVKKATRLDKKVYSDFVCRLVMLGGGGAQLAGQGKDEGGGIRLDGVAKDEGGTGGGKDGVSVTSVESMLRDLDIPDEEIRLWKQKMSWWRERAGVGLEVPLPRPWVINGVPVVDVNGNGKSKGALGSGLESIMSRLGLKGDGLAFKDKNRGGARVSSEGPFLLRVEDDKHRLC